MGRDGWWWRGTKMPCEGWYSCHITCNNYCLGPLCNHVIFCNKVRKTIIQQEVLRALPYPKFIMLSRNFQIGIVQHLCALYFWCQCHPYHDNIVGLYLHLHLHCALLPTFAHVLIRHNPRITICDALRPLICVCYMRWSSTGFCFACSWSIWHQNLKLHWLFVHYYKNFVYVWVLDLK